MSASAARLALVVPVHNDAAGLEALLTQVAGLGCFDQVLIGDDASEPPVTLDQVPASLRGACGILRNPQQGGAGQMRNRALERVRCSHVVFFDSDDLFTAEFVPLWAELRARAFDICLFRHADSRSGNGRGWGQMPLDDALWRLAGLGGGVRSPVRILQAQARATLAETANYPWNKICRTAFLRDKALRFSEIPVHNDIAMHWHVLSSAGEVLASNRVAALHVVHPGGQRLTNRRSADRLRVFEPLQEVLPALRQRCGAQSPMVLAFWRFLGTLMPWVRGTLEHGLVAEFDRRLAGFLADELDREAGLDWLSRADPVLTLRLLLMQAQGGLERQETC